MNETLSGELDPKQYDSILDVLHYAKKHHGDRPAYTCFSRTLTYAEIDEYSDRFAAYLLEQTDLQSGDRIAVQLPNLLQFPIVLFGASKAGLIVVNTNPLYTAREMRHQFIDSGVKAIVILANFCNKLEQIIADTNISKVFITQIGDLQTPLKRLTMNLGIKYLKKMVPAFKLPESVDLNRVLTHSVKGDFNSLTPNHSCDDVALVLYTGGTTGHAKGVMLTHNNLLANTMQLRARCLEIINDKVETILAPLPLYHSYAFLFHCLLMPYAGNHNILIPNPRDLDSIIASFKNNVVTGFVGLNTLYLALLQRQDIRQIDFASLQFCGAGGMPLTRSVADEWEALVGCKIFEGYGLTECSPVVSVNSPSKYKSGSVGLPVVETEVRIVDDSGTALPQGEKGELWIRGPQVMKGYWGNDEDTAKVLTDDGWFKSGDYVQVDSEGYLKIVDRKKDMILVSGFNVIPGEIEEFVNTHPDVLECAAIGVPNSQTGESVVLYVIRKNDSLSQKDLLAFCKTGLTGYKVPKEIIFAKDLPKSIIGKVLRRELRESYDANTRN